MLWSHTWLIIKVANERHQSFIIHVVNTHLSFLLIEIVNDDADEEIEGEEGAENDEDDKVQVHVEVDLSDGLFLHLKPDSFMSLLGSAPFQLKNRSQKTSLPLWNPQLRAWFPSNL